MYVTGLVSQTATLIGVPFGCFAGKVDGDSWFTWWFDHPPGKPIYFPKKDTQTFPGICSPFCFFAFFGSPLFATNQAKNIFFCWGANSSQETATLHLCPRTGPASVPRALVGAAGRDSPGGQAIRGRAPVDSN